MGRLYLTGPYQNEEAKEEAKITFVIIEWIVLWPGTLLGVGNCFANWYWDLSIITVVPSEGMDNDTHNYE